MTVIYTGNGHRKLDPRPVVAWLEQRIGPGVFSGKDKCFPEFRDRHGITARTWARWKAGGNVDPSAVRLLASMHRVDPSEIHPDFQHVENCSTDHWQVT